MQYYKEKINDLKNVIDMMTDINEALCNKIDSMQCEYQIKEDELNRRIERLENEKSKFADEIKSSFEYFSECINSINEEIGKINGQNDRNKYFIKERIDYLNTKIMEIHKTVFTLYPEYQDDKERFIHEETHDAENLIHEETHDAIENNDKVDKWGFKI